MTLSLDTGQILTEKTIIKTNWSQFKNLLTTEEEDIKRGEEIEAAIKKLEEEIIKAAQEASTTKTHEKKDELPKHIKQLIKSKNKTKKEYGRTLHAHVKQHLNHLTK